MTCLLGNIFACVLVRLCCWKGATELEAGEFSAGTAPVRQLPLGTTVEKDWLE